MNTPQKIEQLLSRLYELSDPMAEIGHMAAGIEQGEGATPEIEHECQQLRAAINDVFNHARKIMALA